MHTFAFAFPRGNVLFTRLPPHTCQPLLATLVYRFTIGIVLATLFELIKPPDFFLQLSENHIQTNKQTDKQHTHTHTTKQTKQQTNKQINTHKNKHPHKHRHKHKRTHMKRGLVPQTWKVYYVFPKISFRICTFGPAANIVFPSSGSAETPKLPPLVFVCDHCAVFLW